jgi:hypothetical protein
MPLDKKYTKPLPEELTKDMYRVTGRVVITENVHLLRKYNAHLAPRALIPIERPYHRRGWRDILLVRWNKLGQSLNDYLNTYKPKLMIDKQ